MIKDNGTFDFKTQTGNNVYPNYIAARKVESMRTDGYENPFDHQLRERCTKQGNPVVTTKDLIRDHGLVIEVGYLGADGNIYRSETEDGPVDRALARIMQGYKDGEVGKMTNFDLNADNTITRTK